MSSTLSAATISNTASLVVNYWLENKSLPVPSDAFEPALHDHEIYGAYELFKDNDDRNAILEEADSQLARKLGQRGLWDELQKRRGDLPTNTPYKSSTPLPTLRLVQ